MPRGSPDMVDALLRQHQIGVGVCDAAGTLTHLNARLEEFFGPLRESPAESWGRIYSVFDRTGSRPLRADEMPLIRALRGEVVVDEAVTARRPGLPVRHYRCTAFPLTDADGILEGAIVLVTSAQADAEDREVAARAGAYRRRMARILDFSDTVTAVVDHQVRTPLAVVRGHIEMLADDDDPGRLLPFCLPALTRAVDQLVETMDGLSDLNHMVSASDPDLATVDLLEVAVASARAMVARVGAEVTVTPTSDEYVHITADPVWVRRAITSLIEVVADSARGTVVVHVESREDDLVRITVAPGAQLVGGVPCVNSGQGTLPANPRGPGIPLARAVAIAHGGDVHIADSVHGLAATLFLHRQPTAGLDGGHELGQQGQCRNCEECRPWTPRDEGGRAFDLS